MSSLYTLPRYTFDITKCHNSSMYDRGPLGPAHHYNLEVSQIIRIVSVRGIMRFTPYFGNESVTIQVFFGENGAPKAHFRP